jgi:hypothetical protein
MVYKWTGNIARFMVITTGVGVIFGIELETLIYGCSISIVYAILSLKED